MRNNIYNRITVMDGDKKEGVVFSLVMTALIMGVILGFCLQFIVRL